MASSDNEKEKTGGLVYAIALNPLDLAHLVHNGCDKGLERIRSASGGKDLRTLVRVRPGLQNATFTNTF